MKWSDFDLDSLNPFEMGMLAGYYLGDRDAREELEESDESPSQTETIHFGIPVDVWMAPNQFFVNGV